MLEMTGFLHHAENKVAIEVAAIRRATVEDHILRLKAEKDRSAGLEKELKDLTIGLECMNQKEPDHTHALIMEKANLEKEVEELKAKVSTFAEEMAMVNGA